jgi:short-subunit dehydrogenase
MLLNIPVLIYAVFIIVLATTTESGEGEKGLVGTKIQHHALVFLILACIPIVTAILACISDFVRRMKLSTVYDGEGKAVTSFVFRRYPPFLPDEAFTSKQKYDSVYESLTKKRKQQQERDEEDNAHTPTTGWALVTGASRGIGRAIAISLARRKIPVVLVARDLEKLQNLSSLIQDCYGVKTMAIQCDIGSDDDLNAMMNSLKQAKVDIDILVNNAGLAACHEFVDSSHEKIDQLAGVNLLGPTKLTNAVGNLMKARRRGRIVFISSIAAATPGLPTGAMYGAVKTYQRSLACALGRELEHYGIGVTCIMPGGTRDTSLAWLGNFEGSLMFKFPFLNTTPEVVAEMTVKAMVFGRHEVVTGFVYILLFILKRIVSDRFTLLLSEFLF